MLLDVKRDRVRFKSFEARERHVLACYRFTADLMRENTL